MATSEIDGAHGLPRDIQTSTDELQQVIHGVGGQIISNGIKPESAQRYACILIQRVNRNEEGAEGKTQRMRTGKINVSVLSHKRAKQSDPGLAWFMFHKIYLMYSDINNKEEINANMILTSISEHEEYKKVH